MHRETLEEIQSFEGKYPKQLWHLFFSEKARHQADAGAVKK